MIFKKEVARGKVHTIYTKLKIQMDTENQFDHLIKVLLIGNSGVGKSCLLVQYIDQNFNENYMSTIGVDFKVKTISLQNKRIKMQIWDTAGQERFRTITCNYYRGARGILLVFDLTDRDSFESIRSWVNDVTRFCDQDVQMVLIGNKSDLGNRVVSREEAEEVAAMFEINYIETSAKTNINVDEAFQNIALQFLKTAKNTAKLPNPANSDLLTAKSINAGSCCGFI